MKEIINSELDNKNIGLAKNLWELRQALDVYCMISANTDSLEKKGAGKPFFAFLQRLCIDMVVLNICKIYEYEKNYELNSIEGVLKHIKRISVSNSTRIKAFIFKNGHDLNEGGSLSELSLAVKIFKHKYQEQLERFKTFRDKRVAHSEYGFNVDSLPSYDVMESLFNFGAEFYKLISTDFVSTNSISVVPCDLNSNRKVKVGLKKILHELGLENIKTEMDNS